MPRRTQSSLERNYQTRVLKKIRQMFPGCIILKNDSGYQQGIPDWSVFWYGAWAFLEIKRDANEAPESNQEWFVALASEMSFGAFLYPENEKDVLDDLQRSFEAQRHACFL